MKEKIIIIDDDVSILTAFEEILTECGYSVDTAQDQNSTLERISSKQYDIAIVDMVLKESKGIDIIKILRETFSNIVIVALTGYPPEKFVANSFRYGAVEFLTKPCDRDDLVKAICRGLLQRTKLNDQMNQKSYFPWKQIIKDNPSCVETILKYSKRKLPGKIFNEVKRCENNFECLFKEEPNICENESYLGENICFIKKNCANICKNNNQIAFGYSFFCNCPIRSELFKKYNI